MDGPCSLCGSTAVALCSRCRSRAYCGPACQRADWKQHKLHCAPATSSGAVARGDPLVQGASEIAEAEAQAVPSPISGVPGEPAGHDLVLVGKNSLQNAQRVVDVLRERGVCVLKAGADKTFQKAVHIESRLLWDSGEFGEATRGRPSGPGQVRHAARDDKVVWMTKEWTERNERKCKALKVLDAQLSDFGMGLKPLLEEQLGLTLKTRSCGMLACYAGDSVPGARYDFHVDNPFQTVMETTDDNRRLTLIYYISDVARGPWDVEVDGGALQVCLADPRRAPRSAAEAVRHQKLTVAPECDTMVLFFAHTMYHAVLPLLGDRKRFALSTWFNTGAEE